MNWTYLNQHRVPPSVDPMWGTYESAGFNGMFELEVNGLPVRVIASDGLGWKHVSVSIIGSRMTPSWPMMCQIKDLFWDENDWVIQFHPAHSEYVNNHPGCLHLWQPVGKDFPKPESFLVGIKTSDWKTAPKSEQPDVSI